ncbi:hypothetical protein [Nostoc sp. NZL]|uniref:hypothetical protein n=1 Tax=Nostoc sp. NZL TaxID=2650612 RepID=UPI0018C46485|nr:hypothetical protein [Nostoc sp. NZL]MBG1242113.1 hypothetical protein [Nostoc sp. NZL]
MKLPIQAQPVMRKVGVIKNYKELTDAIVPSVDCGECKLKFAQCGLAVTFDLLNPLELVKLISTGRYEVSEACKWVDEHQHECNPCFPERTITYRDIIRDAM